MEKNNKETGKLRYMSTFSGMGTDTHALRKVFGKDNIECVGWCEIDKYAQIAHNTNFPEHRELLHPDIREIDWERVPDFDLIFGGWPCQPFSKAGKRLGELDPRGTLFYEIAKALEVKKPSMGLFENVEGLLLDPLFPNILKILSDIGYDVHHKLINSKDHGIPQSRKRVWMVVFRKDLKIRDFVFPHGTPVSRCIADVLDPDVPPTYGLTEEQVDLYKYVIAEKQTGFQAEFLKNRHRVPRCVNYYSLKKDGGRSDTKYEMSSRLYDMAGFSSTLTASGASAIKITDTKNIFRKLTLNEATRLQGFDSDKICWEGVPESKAMKILGNGWTVTVAEAILEQIKPLLPKIILPL